MSARVVSAIDVSRPHTAVSSSLDVEVLKALAGTTRPQTGRQVARLVSASQRGVATVLDRLVAHGIVHREEAGRALLYTLNRDHIAAPAVEILADMRPELLRRLRAAFGGWRCQASYASLFGSAARGDGDVDSDIDLFVVRPDGIGEEHELWREQLSRLSREVLAWTGNHAAVVEVPERDLEQLRTSAPPVWQAISRDSVHLWGAAAAELLNTR